MLKNVKRFWSVLRWWLGCGSVVQFCMSLMSLSILCRCHFCTTLPWCISYIIPKEFYFSEWTWNVCNLRYLHTQVIRKQQSPSLLIDAGFDWNSGSFLSWRSDDLMKGFISAFIEKFRHIYFVSISAIIVGPCHGKLFASGGNGD